MKNIMICAVAALVSALMYSCRTDDEELVDKQEEPAGKGARSFFLLNEGNMGSNKCTLDFYDAIAGRYVRNIYGSANPGVVQELGDVGNDIAVYDGKIWAVINCSHFVEVMDAENAKHVTQISIPNCRYITFNDGYAYVSSYAGRVQVDPNARLGYVARIDIATLTVKDTCEVGYQPEEMVISGDHLYVANSGGYRPSNYDRTVSVIDLNTFTVVKNIDVAENLHRMAKDSDGYIWVSSRGDYYGTPSKTFVIDPQTDEVCAELDLPNSGMAVVGDSLYVYGTQWSYVTNTEEVAYAIVNTKTRSVVTRNFITDGTEAGITKPYGLAVDPDTRDVYVTDAGDCMSPGELYCFSSDGRLKWNVRTGDIPAHIAFTDRQLMY